VLKRYINDEWSVACGVYSTAAVGNTLNNKAKYYNTFCEEYDSSHYTATLKLVQSPVDIPSKL
jgi:hypothetical protein